MTNSIKKIKLLTGALLKNSTADADPFKFKGLKIAINIIGSIIMFGCAILVGYFTQILTTAVNLIGGNGTEAAQLILYFINIFGAVFGINVICGLLYFSIDLARILPYPFKPSELFMSKFIVGYLQESIMEFLVIIGIMIGFMISNGFSVLGVIFAIFGVILLPILPLFYCALFSMIFMGFAKKAHSVKGVNMISALCGIVFMLIFAISMFQLSDITVETFIYSIIDGSNVFMNIMQYVFFTIPMLCYAINEQNILLFLLFIVVHIVMVGVLYLLSSKLYSLGISAVMSAGQRKSNKKIKNAKSRSKFSASLNREIKTLLRTPTYIMNCIMPNLLIPLAGIIILATNTGKSIHEFIYSMNSYDVLLIISTIIISCLITAMSGISSSSFTREGNHADLLKYLPIPYKLNVNVKVAISLIFSMPTAVIGITIICIAIDCGMLIVIENIITSIISVIATVYIGVLCDAMHPKLVWEDELSALRGNMSTFLHMAISIAVGIILGLLYFICGNILSVPLILIIEAVITVIIIIYCPKKTEKILEDMTV